VELVTLRGQRRRDPGIGPAEATSSVSSAKTCSGDPPARLSSVGRIDPSIEFSMGTQA